MLPSYRPYLPMVALLPVKRPVRPVKALLCVGPVGLGAQGGNQYILAVAFVFDP